MAGTPIAYSEITILDLIDTATYIYYAEDENGAGATSAPTTTSKYIGIYSGPALDARPESPDSSWGVEVWSGWTKYVGEDGPSGESVTISEVKYEYAKSTDGQNPPTAGWEEKIPSLTGGEYLWSRTTTTYSDGKTTVMHNVSYSGIDGKDSNTYYIETNQEEILRFKESEKYSYSPQFLTFKIYSNPKQSTSEQIEITDESYSLEYYKESGFQKIDKNNEILRRGFISQSEGEEGEVTDVNTVYFSVSSFYENYIEVFQTSQIFRFSYLINQEVAAIKIIQMRNGVSEDMAKLNLHATGIDASIQSGKLSFNANGLTILNNNEPQFYADLNGNLHLKGSLEAANGTFSGVLEAATGSFSGLITAKSGTIGGLTIDENVLYSGSSLTNSPLKIYGTGEVYAQNITLGNNASIENQILLGKAYIKNPDKNEGIFLQAGNISLSETGFFKLGDIQAYGGNETELSYIKAGDNTSFWQINGDGTAQFKEIVVDKATIKNSIMEIGTIQAVGSLMLFKDSWKVENIDNSNFILESSNDQVNLQNGDFITDGNSYYKIRTVNGKIITLENGALTLGQNITKIGTSNDFLMAILGDGSGEKEYAVKNSLTVSKIVDTSGTSPVFKKALVLGDLTGINSNYGTGLYAENVFLNGTLTTQIKDGEEITYAGINTLNGANSIIFGEEDASKIVFWAGSEGTAAEDIQKANFQVTEAGSIYANKGRFEGSLITDSVIKGASIHTAKIYGEDVEGNEVALQIFDAARGIQFINSESTNTIQLGIGSNGLYIGENNTFIDLTEGIKYFGQEAIYSNNSSVIFINPNFIGFDSKIDSVDPAWKMKMNSGFNFTNNEALIFEIKNESIRATQKANFEQNVVFGKNNSLGALDYQKTSEGYYNLYVR